MGSGMHRGGLDFMNMGVKRGSTGKEDVYSGELHQDDLLAFFTGILVFQI